ncbi:MAG: putative glycolipid-binding domain-containing protein, partial [Anaerolineae bacterium]|nr:putative glycolipid-binding domain-containing protein [Anaerolineae bacterium]
MKRVTTVWKRVEYPGMEHMTLREDERGVAVESVVIGVSETGAFRLNYRVLCDVKFRVREVRLALAGQQALYLTGDGRGNWLNGEGHPLPDLKGCIDIDITATPFTNTLPIRRIQWKPGQSETLRMVYFLIPEMTFQPDEQRYTCLEQRADGAVFRFEQPATGFTADLPVDA